MISPCGPAISAMPPAMAPRLSNSSRLIAAIARRLSLALIGLRILALALRVAVLMGCPKGGWCKRWETRAGRRSASPFADYFVPGTILLAMPGVPVNRRTRVNMSAPGVPFNSDNAAAGSSVGRVPICKRCDVHRRCAATKSPRAHVAEARVCRYPRKGRAGYRV